MKIFVTEPCPPFTVQEMCDQFDAVGDPDESARLTQLDEVWATLLPVTVLTPTGPPPCGSLPSCERLHPPRHMCYGVHPVCEVVAGQEPRVEKGLSPSTM